MEGLSDSFMKKYGNYNIVINTDHDLYIHGKDLYKVIEKLLIGVIEKSFSNRTEPWHKKLFKI